MGSGLQPLIDDTALSVWAEGVIPRSHSNATNQLTNLLIFKILLTENGKRKTENGIKRSMDWLIKRVIKMEARVSCQAQRWYVYVTTDFLLIHHEGEVLAWVQHFSQHIRINGDMGPKSPKKIDFRKKIDYYASIGKTFWL
jgi:hypothetical protein